MREIFIIYQHLWGKNPVFTIMSASCVVIDIS